jgi:signal transduction histidine kinase
VRRRSVTSLGDTPGDGNSESPAAGAEQGTLTTGQVPAIVQVSSPAGTGTSPRLSEPRSGTAARRPSASRFALSNWRVRWRLAAVIAIPTITAAILGGIQIGSDLSSSEAAGRVQHLTQLNAAVIVLTQDLENERDFTAGYIAAGRGAPGTPSVALISTLQGLRGLTTAAINTVETDSQGVTTAAGYQSTTVQDLDALLDSVVGDLPYIRTVVDKTMLPAPNAINVYTDNIINGANTFSGAVNDGVNDPQLQSNLTTLAALMRVENQMSVQRGILYAALSATPASLGNQELTSLQEAGQQESAEISDFDASTNVTETQLYGNTVSGTQVDAAQGDETLAESLAETSPNQSLTASGKLSASNWYTYMSTTITDAELVANGPQGLVGAISTRASALKSHWSAELLWTTLITFLLLIIVLLISTIVARSLTRPLRKLRSDALDVAGHRLPDIVRRLSQSEGADEGVEIEPIGVTSTDEIGEVARAFDQVHREAVRLAADEAMLRGNLNAMFINLSRRSQSLIERQLSLIDSLEQTEQDSGRLSSLFRLDHLATRMRRNSENLLVLAGHEVARRWSQPVPLVDVLRAAISEIEQYERVVLNVQPGIVVVGQAVNDVVHLVAEIVENATTFSPEDTQVYVSGQPLSSGGVLLDITDNGVGISDQEMSHANWRLDNPPVVDVAVSRRMGLFVVGRLAARHGVRVRLRHAQAGGLTALIWLPENVAAAEVAPPLGRLRRFDADDYGPAPSLSAPTPGSNAASQANAAARIPRFSSSSPSTSPSFTPVNPSGPGGNPFGPVSQPSQPSQPFSQPPTNPPTNPLGQPTGPTQSPVLPLRGTGAAQPVNGLSGRPDGSGRSDGPGWSDGPSRSEGSGWPDSSGTTGIGAPGQQDDLAGYSSGPSRLPSFGTGQPSTRGGDGLSAQDALDDLDVGASLRAPSGPASALPILDPNSNGTQANGRAFQNGNGTHEVAVPPTATQDQRLPIFDSLESDWFRRSGKSMTANRGTGPQPQLQPAQATWTSPADEGWRAAEVVAAPAAGETTQAGLPKRVPWANLVPGSVGGGDHDGAAPQAAPVRTADDIRSRMSSFQRGVREGRAAAPQIEEQ